MCWSIEVSLGSAVLGWIACLYLYRRNYSRRDRWYARYLFTFTLSQLVDISLWLTHAANQKHGLPFDAEKPGLRACPELAAQLSLRLPAPESGQREQFLVSKFTIPAVTFLQFANQLTYPGAAKRFGSFFPSAPSFTLLLLHGLGCLGMCFGFACTDIQLSLFPTTHESLRWGGISCETWQVLCVVALICLDFQLTMEEVSVRLAHTTVFLSVVGFLYVTEGSLAVGSKWCTYCLIFSGVYSADPLWGPGSWAQNDPDSPAVKLARAAKARKGGKVAQRSESASPFMTAAPLAALAGVLLAAFSTQPGTQLMATLQRWVARAHDSSWPWRHVNDPFNQFEFHATFLVAEFIFYISATLALLHACLTGRKLLWALTFIAGTANDYIFMLMPMVDNFWQAQAVLMLTPRMPLYIPCVYNAFMYWGVAAAQCVAAGTPPASTKSSTVSTSTGSSRQQLSRLGEACLAGLLGAVLYAPYDLCGARFLWWTWHLDDAGVKLRWGAGAGGAGGVPVGSTSWTLVFGFCFAWLLRFARDRNLSAGGTVAIVAGFSTFAMMGLLTGLSAVAGDRMGMPGPYTLWASLCLLGTGSLPELWRRARMAPHDANQRRAAAGSSCQTVDRVAQLFLGFFFAALALTMALGSPELQVSTGVHQPFAVDVEDCTAEDKDMVEYRRLRYTCHRPPRHLPASPPYSESSGVGGVVATPWHARGWAHNANELPVIHEPGEYFSFDCGAVVAEAKARLTGPGPGFGSGFGFSSGAVVLPEAITPEALARRQEHGPRLSSWYTVCGVESSNSCGLLWCVVLGLVGFAAYRWALAQGAHFAAAEKSRARVGTRGEPVAAVCSKAKKAKGDTEDCAQKAFTKPRCADAKASAEVRRNPLAESTPVVAEKNREAKGNDKEGCDDAGGAAVATPRHADAPGIAATTPDQEKANAQMRRNPLAESSQEHWVQMTNRKELTRFGKFVKHALDPVVEPVLAHVPLGWAVASVGLAVLAVATQMAAGMLLRKALVHAELLGPDARTRDSEQLLLQPVYDSAKWLLSLAVPTALRGGALGWRHPLVPSVIAIGSHFVLVFVLTLFDVFGSRFAVIQKLQTQSHVKNGRTAESMRARFGGESLGLWRTVKSHILLQLILCPVYAGLIANTGPFLYTPPWFDLAKLDLPQLGEAAAAALPARAPTVLEFVLTFGFCLVTMDAGYGWWHFLAHRYRQIYKHVHAWHHEYHAPFALVAQHAHPIELLLTAGLSICPGTAVGCHPLSMWAWLFTTVAMSVEAHCGYELPWWGNLRVLSLGVYGGSRHHDDHHRKPWGNFAPFLGWLDVAFGTGHGLDSK